MFFSLGPVLQLSCPPLIVLQHCSDLDPPADFELLLCNPLSTLGLLKALMGLGVVACSQIV